MQVKVGDILQDRDSRRKGRQVRVLWVDPDGNHVTVETIRDAENAVKSSVGNTTDVLVGRLSKAYTVYESPADVVDNVLQGYGVVNTEPDVYWDEMDDDGYYECEYYDDDMPDDYVPSFGSDFLDVQNDEYGKEPEEKEDSPLEEALNSVGYHYVPELEELQRRVDGYLHSLSKKDIVELVHGIITEL